MFSILAKGDLLIALWCHSAVKLYDKVSVPSVAAANCRRTPWEPACFTDKPWELWNVWGAAGPAVPQVKLFSPLNLEQSAQATLRKKDLRVSVKTLWERDTCVPIRCLPTYKADDSLHLLLWPVNLGRCIWLNVLIYLNCSCDIKWCWLRLLQSVILIFSQQNFYA